MTVVIGLIAIATWTLAAVAARKRRIVARRQVLAMVLAPPAFANPWRHGGLQVQMQRQQTDRYQRQPQRDYRQAPQRDFRQAPPPDRGQRDGRMTEQDRRDLHRDLDRANRELYKDRR